MLSPGTLRCVYVHSHLLRDEFDSSLENMSIRSQLKQISELIEALLDTTPAALFFELKILPSLPLILNDRMKSTILRSSILHQPLKLSVELLKETEGKMNQRSDDPSADEIEDLQLRSYFATDEWKDLQKLANQKGPIAN